MAPNDEVATVTDESNLEPSPETSSNDMADAVIKIQSEQLSLSKKQFYTNAALNIVLALSTVVLAVVTSRLYVSTDIMRSASQDQVRPYVFPSLISRNAEGDVFLSIKNVGLTPAYAAYVQGESFVAPQNNAAVSLPDIDRDCSYTSGEAMLYNLGSNQESKNIFLAKVKNPSYVESTETWTLPKTDSFSKEELDSVASGKNVLMTMGIICYGDSHTRKYYSKFCKVFSGPGFFTGQSDLVKDAIENGRDCNTHTDAN